MANIFPEYCGWCVAEWWCPMTETQTILVILILSITLGTAISYFQLRKELQK